MKNTITIADHILVSWNIRDTPLYSGINGTQSIHAIVFVYFDESEVT